MTAWLMCFCNRERRNSEREREREKKKEKHSVCERVEPLQCLISRTASGEKPYLCVC